MKWLEVLFREEIGSEYNTLVGRLACCQPNRHGQVGSHYCLGRNIVRCGYTEDGGVWPSSSNLGDAAVDSCAVEMGRL